MIDILYVGWNRLEFTKATFAALAANTDWNLVRHLHIHDDGSTDGTREWLRDAWIGLPVNVKYESLRLGGPVGAMNRHLDLCPPSDDCGAFVKIDSDFVVCPGWLPELLRVSTLNPGVDIFGVQPRIGPPTRIPDESRTVEECRHIGGIGLIRYRAFEVCRPTPQGRFGWTEWQCDHPATAKAWVTPDMPCFSLDLIDAEPWRTLTCEYLAKGWQREWPKYVDGGRSYFDWWKPVHL